MNSWSIETDIIIGNLINKVLDIKPLIAIYYQDYANSLTSIFHKKTSNVWETLTLVDFYLSDLFSHSDA